MGSLALLQSLKESILGQASVKAIYGEPISAHEKTIIPVAKVMYAYGAGAGTGGVGDKNTRGEGTVSFPKTIRPRHRTTAISLILEMSSFSAIGPPVPLEADYVATRLARHYSIRM